MIGRLQNKAKISKFTISHYTEFCTGKTHPIMSDWFRSYGSISGVSGVSGVSEVSGDPLSLSSIIVYKVEGLLLGHTVNVTHFVPEHEECRGGNTNVKIIRMGRSYCRISDDWRSGDHLTRDQEIRRFYHKRLGHITRDREIISQEIRRSY